MDRMHYKLFFLAQIVDCDYIASSALAFYYSGLAHELRMVHPLLDSRLHIKHDPVAGAESLEILSHANLSPLALFLGEFIPCLSPNAALSCYHSAYGRRWVLKRLRKKSMNFQDLRKYRKL